MRLKKKEVELSIKTVELQRKKNNHIMASGDMLKYYGGLYNLLYIVKLASEFIQKKSVEYYSST